YSTSSIAVNTTVSGQVSITPTLSSTTQTSDADFSAWSKSSNVYVPTGGNKITLLKPDGASCTTGTQCSSGICTGNLCVPPPCAYATSLVYSGETYPLKELGTQCWFAKNLNVGTMLAAGTTMPSNNSLIEKWCYGNNSFNCTVWYGALYTWAEANQFDPGCNTSSCTASSTPNQGICPSGWHIPTDAEFKTLESYLGMCAGAGIGCVDAIGERGGGIGTKLKSGGSSGFNLLLGGYRSTAGDFSWNNYYGKLWSASQYDASQGWYRSVDSSQDKVYRNGVNKVFGHSVRCLKN
ncbi:MAG: fibrobacter succinogenes major paralogous domain-containing protein, partial [Candidatus Magasanikbacteria bacterium]